MPTGWVGSKRRAALPPGWAATVKRILQRDLWRCQWVRESGERAGRRCLAKASDVDHIVRPDEGGSEADSNLRSLCSHHHKLKTGREGGEASGRARRAKKAAAAPLHPGVMPPVDPAPF